MVVETTYIAVICAVGVPIAIAVCIAIFFWNRARLRLKKEDEELNGYLKKDDVSIYSTVVEGQRAHIENQLPQDNSDVLATRYFANDITVPGSSSSVTTNDEKLNNSDKNTDSTMSEDTKEPKRSASKYYVPAYRRKLNTTLAAAQNGRQLEEASATNSSMTSFETQKAQVSIFEQMVPIITIEHLTVGGGQEHSMLCEKSSVNSNENLMKSLKSHDFGSYPKQKPFTVQINSSTFSTGSLSPSVSRAPSSSSLNKLSREDHSSYSDAIPAPRTARASNIESSTELNDVYILKNNYDLTNDAEIAEEDQYENEFTNYSENKREFIDSLRPKASKY